MQTIHVKGYRETVRSLNAVNRGAKRALQAGLREAAQPIASDTRSRLSGYRGISLATINPSATTRGVSIVQRAKRVTGKRPDFGALQMRRGLIPAVRAADGEIRDRVEEAFAALAHNEGL